MTKIKLTDSMSYHKYILKVIDSLTNIVPSLNSKEKDEVAYLIHQIIDVGLTKEICFKIMKYKIISK